MNVDHFVARFLGAGCRLCAAPTAAGLELCRACHAELPFLGNSCEYCARRLPSGGGVCGRCQRKPPPFTRVIVPLRYTDDIAQLIRTFKLSRDLAAGRLLGELLAGACATYPSLPNTLIPLPLHRARLRTRGFNQAAELCRCLPGRRRHDILRRHRDTPTQTGLGQAERRRNVRGAFAVAAESPPRAVLLVDDVITTGATLGEAAQSLRRAGVEQVWAAAVARAERADNRY